MKTAWNDQMPPADHQYKRETKERQKNKTDELRFFKVFDWLFDFSTLYVSKLSHLFSLVVYSKSHLLFVVVPELSLLKRRLIYVVELVVKHFLIVNDWKVSSLCKFEQSNVRLYTLLQRVVNRNFYFLFQHYEFDQN